MKCSSLCADQRAVALIEFAIVLPFLALIYLGGFTFANAMAFNRKLTTAARAVADLTAQRSSVDQQALQTILSVKAPIMVPFTLPSGISRVSEISTDGSNNATVSWSYASEGAALIKGNSYSLPSDIAIPNAFYVVADLQYSFKPITSYSGIVSVPLGEHIIMLPRKSKDVPCTDC